MFLAVGEQMLDNIDDQMVQMVRSLMGGVGGTQQEMCGVLSAGVMITGALIGARRPGDDEEALKQAVAAYRDRFIAEIGPTKCATLRDGLYGSGGQEPCSVLARRGTSILLDVLEEYT